MMYLFIIVLAIGVGLVIGRPNNCTSTDKTSKHKNCSKNNKDDFWDIFWLS